LKRERRTTKLLKVPSLGVMRERGYREEKNIRP